MYVGEVTLVQQPVDIVRGPPGAHVYSCCVLLRPIPRVPTTPQGHVECTCGCHGVTISPLSRTLRNG